MTPQEQALRKFGSGFCSHCRVTAEFAQWQHNRCPNCGEMREEDAPRLLSDLEQAEQYRKDFEDNDKRLKRYRPIMEKYRVALEQIRDLEIGGDARQWVDALDGCIKIAREALQSQEQPVPENALPHHKYPVVQNKTEALEVALEKAQSTIRQLEKRVKTLKGGLEQIRDLKAAYGYDTLFTAQHIVSNALGWDAQIVRESTTPPAVCPTPEEPV